MKFCQSYFLLVLVISSCSGERSAQRDELVRDTVYANTHHLQNRDYYEQRRTVIKITDTNDSYIGFKIGRTDTVKIAIANFTQYPTELRNTKNVDWSQLEKGLYTLTPSDSVFYLEFWQNYDSGRVVLKYFDSSGQAHTSDYDGWRIAGKSEFEAE